ncbi:12575_t:CDS:1, partial [Racocetra fulgida]
MRVLQLVNVEKVDAKNKKKTFDYYQESTYIPESATRERNGSETDNEKYV